MTPEDVKQTLGPRWRVTIFAGEEIGDVVLPACVQAEHVAFVGLYVAVYEPYDRAIASYGDCTGEGPTLRAAFEALLVDIEEQIARYVAVRPLIGVVLAAACARDDERTKGTP